MTTPLSPAQLALAAAHRQPFMDADGRPNFAGAIAAALRVVADQTLLIRAEPKRSLGFEGDRDAAFIGAWHIWNAERKAHAKMLAIATELESTP